MSNGNVLTLGDFNVSKLVEQRDMTIVKNFVVTFDFSQFNDIRNNVNRLFYLDTSIFDCDLQHNNFFVVPENNHPALLIKFLPKDIHF